MTPLGLLLSASLVLLIAGGVRRGLRWRRGRAARVEWLHGLAAVPKRYLVDVHEVVARDRFTAAMHITAAGGVVVAVLLTLVVHVAGVRHPLPVAMVGAAAVLVGIGAVLEFLRRSAGELGRTGQLSRGAWSRLPWSLLALAAGLGGLSVPGAITDRALVGGLLALCGWGLVEVMGGALWNGPMKHAIAGLLHLAYHPRPERFQRDAGAAGRASALEPLDLDRGGLEAGKLGAEAPSDFAWNRLLGFDACVQCGRCETACPAFAAGQPLNPKKLIQDLVIGLELDGDDRAYAGHHHPGRSAGDAAGGAERPIVGGLVDAATVWACTTCRACVHECPMLIEHVDGIVALRRFLTLERGEVPGQAPAVIAALRETDNTHGRAPESRLDWATDLDVPRLGDRAEADVLLWVGDGAFDRRHQITLRALVKLMQTAGIDFAVLGEQECDTGDVARRLGDEATFQTLARRNVERLNRYRFNLIVTADPHVLHCLKNEYPAFGGHYRVVHHSTYLAELLALGALVVKPDARDSITYHDPCYLARYNRETQAPRAVLHALGATVTEMQRSGLRARCCGGGGGAPFTDVPGERRIPDMRMDDARDTGAKTIAVACPNCMTMLEGVVQPRPEVRDIAELLWEATQR